MLSFSVRRFYTSWVRSVSRQPFTNTRQFRSPHMLRDLNIQTEHRATLQHDENKVSFADAHNTFLARVYRLRGYLKVTNKYTKNCEEVKNARVSRTERRLQ